MKTPFDRIVMTVIALALSVIALNPWLAPGRVGANEGIMKVTLVEKDGTYLNWGNPLPVRVNN